MVCWRRRREGFTGREFRWTFMRRMREGSVSVSRVGPVPREDEEVGGKRISQQSASRPNRLGYFTRQTRSRPAI